MFFQACQCADQLFINQVYVLNLFQADETIQRAGSFHANLIWFPYSRVSTGIEYMWGLRENKNGVQGTASRIQFMVKFIFN
jgi:hypothetical protein